MTLTFHIVSRVQTRSTQYNRRDIVKAIERAGCTIDTIGGLIFHVNVTTLEQRKTLEAHLKAVHRNVAYYIKVSA